MPAAGGSRESIIEPQQGEQYADFEVDTENDVAVFTVWGAPYRVEAMRLSTGERTVVTPGVKPFLVEGGYLVFASVDGQILGARFDPEAMSLAGPAIPIVDGVRVDGDDWPYYSVARDRTLLYWSGASTSGNDARVVRVDRRGNVSPVDPAWFFNPGTPEVPLALSPDGRRLAVKITGDTGDDIWVKQLDDGPLSQLTFYDGVDRRPRWSSDGARIIYNSDRGGEAGHYDLWTQPADGTGSPEMLLDLEGSILEMQLTPDESVFALRVGGLSNVFGVRAIVSLEVGSTEPRPVAAEPYDEKGLALSPDGKWIAYESTETGCDEVYVRPFPNSQDGKWQVSSLGGVNPKWSHSGEELFYVSADEMTAARVSTEGGTLRILDRRPLFNVVERALDAGTPNYASWDVDVDDQAFIMIQFGGGTEDAVPNEFILVQNWIEELRDRLGRY